MLKVVLLLKVVFLPATFCPVAKMAPLLQVVVLALMVPSEKITPFAIVRPPVTLRVEVFAARPTAPPVQFMVRVQMLSEPSRFAPLMVIEGGVRGLPVLKLT